MKCSTHFGFVLVMISSGFGAASYTARESDEIREAVFRYMFLHNDSGQQQRANVYCLALGAEHEDPSDNLVKRFAGHSPRVRKVSECKFDRKLGGVRDGENGQFGLIFRIESILFVSPIKASVTGGYYEGPLSSSGNTFTVKKAKGKWKVVQWVQNWIS